MGALVLAAVAAVVTYFLTPSCSGYSLPESLTRSTQRISDDPKGNEPAAKYVRLPRSIEPSHYRLYILPKLQTDFKTSGNVTIRLRVNAKTDEILLNALDLNISEHSVSLRRPKDGKIVKVAKQKYISDSQIYSINLDESLNSGEEYELSMDFAGKLNDYLFGFYRSGYKDSNNKTKWMASTQFSPTDARRAFPCFDEPSFKAKYTISIARTTNMSTLSNMPKKDSTVIPNENLIWDNYQETPIMPSYLVAFIVHDFVPYQNNLNKTFTVWTRPSRISQARYAADTGPQVLSYFERYFGIKFALPKLDIIALPDFGFAAMENWGLITFKETMLLADRHSSTVMTYRNILRVLAHELAHSWFGNLVTPEWWDNLWLKEGFANYFAYEGMNHVKPEWNILDEFFRYETCKAAKSDSLSSSRPIHFDLKTADDIRQVFDSISYSKGATIVKMIAEILGENSFRDAVQVFLKTFEYSNANHEDLWKVLTEQSHKDAVLEKNTTMKDIMKGWITQAGYPVVTVVADYDKNILKLHQNRFFINGKTKSNEKWWIPISYTTGTNTSFEDGKPKLWMRNEDHVTLNLNLSSWYLLNLKQGYYITNYDQKNWRILTEHIMLLPPVVRAQLVSDSMDLAKAGLLDYSIPLSIITNIGIQDKQIIFVPLLTVFEKTDFLYNILHNTPAFGIFEKYFWYIFYYALENVDFRENPDDSYLTQRIRMLVLKQACRQPNFKCALNARQIYRSWMERNYRISPNIRDVVYCTAIRDGGEEEWNFAYKEYLISQSASEKETILTALGCTSKHWLLAKYLDMMISNSSGIRKQDGIIVFESIAGNIYGHNLAFDFLRNRWNEINEYYGKGFGIVSKMVHALATFMNTPEHLKQLENFRDDNKYNLKATNQAFTNTIERVKSNIEWIKMNYKSVESWLTQQVAYYRI